MMAPFEKFTAVAAPLLRANVNTDAIIPGAWLRSVDADLGGGLFFEWRHDSDGRPDPDFILNREPFDKARILFAGENFGCGSSREAAVWALQRYGFKAIFSVKFADIFYENAQRNGLLLGLVSAQTIHELSRFAREENPQFTVDLENCRISSEAGSAWTFDILQSRRAALLRGDDEIAMTLARADEIDAFQAADRKSRPWAYTVIDTAEDRHSGSDTDPAHNQGDPG